MRAVTFAAAGAAVITTVSAASHVKHMHAKLHGNVVRDTWVDWNATASASPTSELVVDPKTTKTTTTTTTPAAEVTTTTTSTFLWEDWTSTSSLEVDPATASTSTSSSTTSFEHTWEDWTSTATSSIPVDPATTSSTSVEHTWVDWTSESSGSSTPVDPATTSTETEHTWADWTTSTPVDPATAASTETDHTWADWTTSTPVDPATATSTETEHTWGDWTTSTPVDPATATSTETEHTWGDWTTSTPVDPATATSTETEHTWGDWTTSDPVKPVTTGSATSTETWGDWTSAEPTTTITLASTVTATKYIQPISGGSSTWADWTSASISTSIPVDAVTSVITSTVTPDWSSKGWFGPSWSVEAGSCAVSIITSYGLPTWHPTPAAPVSSTSSTSSIATWANRTSSTTSTTPAAAVTTSTTSAVTWADWTSTSTSISPASTSTSTASATTWADWTSSSESTVETGAATWAWSAPTESAVGTETATWGWSAPSESAVETKTATWSWSAPSESASASASASSSGSHPKPSGGSGGSAGISSNGDSWGLTYSPYTSEGGCKDAGTVAADLAIIAQKGFSSVRVYSTDCSTLENIGKSARDNGLKLILGVWISSSGIGGAQGQVEDIIAWAQWDLVELIVVGNEAVFNGYASASELAGFISSSAGAFKGAGYTGLVTTTEPLSVWEDTSSSSAFCSVVDVVGANLYAFFNAAVTADKAGGFIQDQINILNGICSGKAVYVLESGWPHSGNCNGAACPSPANQATALKGIQSTVGAQVVFLSFEDEPWKEPGQFDVEQFWGCADVF